MKKFNPLQTVYKKTLEQKEISKKEKLELKLLKEKKEIQRKMYQEKVFFKN